MRTVGNPRRTGSTRKVALAVVKRKALLAKAHDKATLDVRRLWIKGHKCVQFVGALDLFVLFASQVDTLMVIFMVVIHRTIAVCPPYVHTGM